MQSAAREEIISISLLSLFETGLFVYAALDQWGELLAAACGEILVVWKSSRHPPYNIGSSA